MRNIDAYILGVTFAYVIFGVCWALASAALRFTETDPPENACSQDIQAIFGWPLFAVYYLVCWLFLLRQLNHTPKPKIPRAIVK